MQCWYNRLKNRVALRKDEKGKIGNEAIKIMRGAENVRMVVHE